MFHRFRNSKGRISSSLFTHARILSLSYKKQLAFCLNVSFSNWNLSFSPVAKPPFNIAANIYKKRVHKKRPLSKKTLSIILSLSLLLLL